MLIKLSPVRMDANIQIAKLGDMIVVDGQNFDFTQLPEGAALPAEAIASEHFAGPVERNNGELCLTLRLPHGPNPPKHVAFPEPIYVLADGLISLPGSEAAYE